MSKLTLSLAGHAQGRVQDGHELCSTALASRRQRVSVQNIDQDGCGALSSFLDQPEPDGEIIVRVQFSNARGACGGSQDVTDLGGFRDRMEVGRRGGISGGACSEPCGFRGRLLCRPVGVKEVMR